MVRFAIVGAQLTIFATENPYLYQGSVCMHSHIGLQSSHTQSCIRGSLYQIYSQQCSLPLDLGGGAKPPSFECNLCCFTTRVRKCLQTSAQFQDDASGSYMQVQARWQENMKKGPGQVIRTFFTPAQIQSWLYPSKIQGPLFLISGFATDSHT